MKNVLLEYVEKAFQSDRIKGKLNEYKYRYVNKLIKDRPVHFLNYGFAPTAGQECVLEQQDEDNRLCIQLYHRVAAAADLGGMDVLEMSCGRGGGAAYIRKYLKPRHVLGADLTDSAVMFCHQQHAGGELVGLCRRRHLEQRHAGDHGRRLLEQLRLGQRRRHR